MKAISGLPPPVAWLLEIAWQPAVFQNTRAVGTGRPAPTSREDRGHAPSAATTFEKTLLIWLPMVKRITMTTIETRTKIKAYSTMP